MSEAQQRIQAFKRVLGGFVNIRPRDFDTDESTHACIDRVVSALDAIRPKAGHAETSEPPAKRQKKAGRNRMHTGGRDREG